MQPLRRALIILSTLLAIPLAAHAQAAADVNITNPVYAPGQVIIPADALPVMETEYLVGGDKVDTIYTDLDIVPVGYRLIIDYVAVSAGSPSGQRVWGMVQPCYNLKGGEFGATPVPTIPVTTADDSYQNLGVTAMHAYAEPGCRPRVLLIRGGKTGNFGGHVTLQGHYGRIPPTSK